MEKSYGTVTVDGEIITLRQDAYADDIELGNYNGTYRAPCYKAYATRADGRVCEVIWLCDDSYDGDEPADSVNWSNPFSVRDC